MFSKLQISFFDVGQVTEEKPFTDYYEVEYEVIDVSNEVGHSSIDNVLEIKDKQIAVEKMELVINSRYYNGSISIEFRVDEFMSYISFNLKSEEETATGTIMISKHLGFHYALIK